MLHSAVLVIVSKQRAARQQGATAWIATRCYCFFYYGHSNIPPWN